MDLTEYRERDTERARTADLLSLTPRAGGRALDVGARDGYYSKLLAERFDEVTALDLERPTIEHPRVRCVAGDVTSLDFEDGSFDFVLCAEVLEHVPSRLLDRACAELQRVVRRRLLVGVPYRQDTRVGRTTCAACGKLNPPWGHVHTFDERRLTALLPRLDVRKISFVGETRDRTNALSALLMDLAGNPYGTYSQDEPCIHCGAKLADPPPRSLAQKVLTKAAFWTASLQRPFVRKRPYWVHVLLANTGGEEAAAAGSASASIAAAS